MIHPSAIIDPKAELASDVHIGPGCTIEGNVTIASGTTLVGYVYLKGPLTIGSNNRIYPFACLGFDPQDLKFDPLKEGAGTVIGNDNIIRESVTIHRATKDKPTTLGNNNYLMANCHMAHDTLVGNRVTLVNGCLLGGHVSIQDQALISGNSVVHQFCRVGRLAIMSGAQGITQDLPPFCMQIRDRLVAALNMVGLRRAGLRSHIPALQTAFDILYRRKLPNDKSVALIRHELSHDPLCMELAAFVETSKRGICRYIARHASHADEYET